MSDKILEELYFMRPTKVKMVVVKPKLTKMRRQLMSLKVLHSYFKDPQAFKTKFSFVKGHFNEVSKAVGELAHIRYKAKKSVRTIQKRKKKKK